MCGSKKKKSPLGRTKTIPRKDAHVEQDIKFAVYSCSNYRTFYFNFFNCLKTVNRNVMRKKLLTDIVHLEHSKPRATSMPTGTWLRRTLSIMSCIWAITYTSISRSRILGGCRCLIGRRLPCECVFCGLCLMRACQIGF